MTSTRLLLLALVAAFTHMACAVPAADDPEDDPGTEISEDLLEQGRRNTEGFKDVDAEMSKEETAAIVDRYSWVRHDGVRDELFRNAVVYYDTNKDRIRNKKYLSILDFSMHSGKRRFFVLDMGGGPVKSFVVAHGSGSDPEHDGVATKFSNVMGSNMSSVGFYVTAEQYTGSHGLSMRLDGLSSTNSAVRERFIVIHQASYVKDGEAKQGRSQGCMAFSSDDKPKILDWLKDGAIIYASN